MYEENLDTDERRGIGIILSEAKRLTKLVEELLEFTRMQDGRFTLNVEQIDIVAELEDSIFTYGELLKQEGIKLEYEPWEGELDMIPGDPARLKQVFLNILDNASKYGRDGGRIIVSLETDDDNVYIKFRDFGPGVPEDELPNVKMKFYKGSSKERGSGIGLAVCDEIVRLHNGTLELQNVTDGTTGLEVTVKLPRTAN
jgi:signal transduction histidine kinase